MKKQPTVLIAEDESIFLMMLTRGLRKSGFEVCSAVSSGEIAVEQAQFHMPDLFLLDIHLNGRLSGIDAAKQIRGFSDSPIFFITGYPEDYAEELIASIPAARILYKPLTPGIIDEVFRETLGSD